MVNGSKEAMSTPIVTDEVIEHCFKVLREKLRIIKEKKGTVAFWNAHEALGVLTEEYIEFVDAVRSNVSEDIQHEAIDVIVSAFWWLCSKETYDRIKAERLLKEFQRKTINEEDGKFLNGKEVCTTCGGMGCSDCF